MLLSPAFIDSDYVFDKEIPAIKKRHRTDNVLVLPVLVARCAWEVVIKRPQVLPTQNRRVKPITDWSPHSHGFNQARAEMHDAIASHFNIKPRRARL